MRETNWMSSTWTARLSSLHKKKEPIRRSALFVPFIGAWYSGQPVLGFGDGQRVSLAEGEEVVVLVIGIYHPSVVPCSYGLRDSVTGAIRAHKIQDRGAALVIHAHVVIDSQIGATPTQKYRMAYH